MTDAQASYLQPCPNKHNKLLTIRNDLTKAEALNSLTRCAKRLGSNRCCRRKSIFAKRGRDTREGSGKKKGSGRSIEEVHPSAAKSAVLVEKIGQPPTLKAQLNQERCSKQTKCGLNEEKWLHAAGWL
jgi:hypothetical protein